MDLSSFIAEVEEFNKFKRRPGATAAVFSCDYVTYISTLKCGSSFFTATFEKNFRWPKIHFDDIRWDHSHVFSFMIEPLTRRYKAIAEWLSQNRLTNEFYVNPELQKFVLTKPIIDIHSYGYVYNYYDYSQQIDWIPTDVVGSHNDIKNLVSIMMEKNYISVMDKWATAANANISSSYKKKLEFRIKEMFEENPSQEILDYLAPDVELYNNVIERFNPCGKTWDEISWLRK